jgi:hypothetical protein
MVFVRAADDGYTISDDPARFDLPLAHRWMEIRDPNVYTRGASFETRS